MKQPSTTPNSGNEIPCAVERTSAATSLVKITLPYAEIEITPLGEPSEKRNIYGCAKESEPVIDPLKVAITEPDSETSQMSVDMQKLNKPGYIKPFMTRETHNVCIVISIFCAFYFAYVYLFRFGFPKFEIKECYMQIPFIGMSILALWMIMAMFSYIHLSRFVKEEGYNRNTRVNRRDVVKVCFHFLIVYIAFPLLIYLTHQYHLGITSFTICIVILAVISLRF